MWVAWGLVAVEECAAIGAGLIRQRSMDEEWSEEGDGACADFERDEARGVVAVGIDFEAAESFDGAALLQALAMATRHDFEASSFDGRVVEEEHRGGDAIRDGSQVLPVWKILVEDDRPALLRAFQVELLGEQDYLVGADDVLAWIEDARVVGPSIQILAEMRERLEALYDIEVAGLPFDHGAKVALE